MNGLSAGLLAVLVGLEIACSALPGNEGGEAGPHDASLDGSVPDCSGAGGSRCLDGAGPSSPSLSALSVTASSDASLALSLVPPFDPGVHDYYVRCATGANVVDISMAAAPGSESALVRPTRSAPAPTQTLSNVPIVENEAVVASATRGGRTVEYWVRCLPADFPGLLMERHADAGPLEAGYYLVGSAVPTPSPGYAMVLDGNGVPVWYHREPSGGVVNVDHLVPGVITYKPIRGGPIEIETLSRAAFTTAAPVGVPLDPHELRVLPGGNYLVFSSPPVTADLTGLSVPLPDGGTLHPGAGAIISACNVVEFDPRTGKIAWTWQATDHFDPAKDAVTPVAMPPLPDGGVTFDTFHCNAIDVDPANGNLLVSSRQMSSVFYVERPTGRVLWKMGGARASKDGAPYVPVDSAFDEQHDARLLPGFSACGGHVTVLDDETLGKMPARAVIYDVSLGSAGAGCGSGAPAAKLAWEHRASASSVAAGSFRIWGDGTRLIDWGFESGIVFTEVDEKGRDLLDFSFVTNSESYRAVKVPLGALDLAEMRSAAGL